MLLPSLLSGGCMEPVAAEDWSDLGVVVVVVVVLGEEEECLFCCARQTPAGMSDGQETADVDVVEELVVSVVVKGGGVLGNVGVVGSGRFRWVVDDEDDTVGGLDDSSADKKEEEEDDSIPALRSLSFSCDDSTNFPSVVVGRLRTTIRKTTSRQFQDVVEWRVQPGLVLPFLLLLLLLLLLFLVMMLPCAT